MTAKAQRNIRCIAFIQIHYWTRAEKSKAITISHQMEIAVEKDPQLREFIIDDPALDAV